MKYDYESIEDRCNFNKGEDEFSKKMWCKEKSNRIVTFMNGKMHYKIAICESHYLANAKHYKTRNLIKNMNEKLQDLQIKEGYYQLGDAIYDKQGNFIESLEEYKKSSIKKYE